MNPRPPASEWAGMAWGGWVAQKIKDGCRPPVPALHNVTQHPQYKMATWHRAPCRRLSGDWSATTTSRPLAYTSGNPYLRYDDPKKRPAAALGPFLCVYGGRYGTEERTDWSAPLPLAPLALVGRTSCAGHDLRHAA